MDPYGIVGGCGDRDVYRAKESEKKERGVIPNRHWTL